MEAGIDFYAPESRTRIAQVFGRAVATGEPFDEELQLITAKGKRIWVRAIGHPYLEEGKVVRVGGVFQDIQARKLVEEDLKRHHDHLGELVAERTADLEQSQAHLVEAQGVAHLGSWEWDASRDDLSGSEEFYRLFGVPPERMGKLSQFLDLIHPEDRETVQRSLSRAMEAGREGRYRAVYRVPRRGGGFTHLDARGVVSVDAEGTPAGMVGTCLDITELKEAEESLRAANDRLRRSEYLLNETGRMARVGGWELDLQTNRLTWTEETRRIHEVPPDFEPTVEKAIGFYHPEDQAKIAQAVRRAIDHSEPFDLELRVITTRGREVWVQAIGHAHEQGGAAIRVAGAFQDITERRRAEEALRASEERLRRVTSTVPGMLYDYVLEDDGAGRFLFVSPHCRELLEVGAEDLLADAGLFWKMVHPEDLQRLHDEDAAANRGSRFFSSECRIVTPSGRLKWLHITSKPNPPLTGEPATWSGVMLDVTDRKGAEEEKARAHLILAAQRELLETVVRALPLGVLLFRGPDYVVETMNPAYQAVAPGKQVLGRTLAEIWPEVYASIRPLFDRVRETGEPYQAFDARFEIRRTEAGPLETAYFNWSLVRTRLPGSNQWGLLNTVVDTTEQVKARKAMELLEERLVLAQEASGSGTWDWDMESGLLAWSPEFFRLYDLDPAKQQAGFETWRAAVHPEDLKSAEETIAERIRDHAPLKQTYRILLKSGEYRWIEARGNTTYDGAGTPKRMSGLSLDITERVRIEEELKAHREHLEELVQARTAELAVANRELESYSYSVSHDLRAPLRALDGFSAALLAKYTDKLDDQGKHYLVRIQIAAQRMGHLIDDLLNLSRVGRRELSRVPFDLSAVARAVATELHALDPGRGSKFRIAEGLTVEADPHLLRIVLENLMGNAVKFSSKRPDPMIEVGVRFRDGEKAFFVRDNGVGFDMAYAGKLFAPFQRLHGADEFPGTGIGLATVHRVIARHRGRIWAESSVGGGAAFFFTIGGSDA